MNPIKLTILVCCKLVKKEKGKILITVANVIPAMLIKKGNHFVKIGNHSASKVLECCGNTNIAFPQKSVPKPIKISRVI